MSDPRPVKVLAGLSISGVLSSLPSAAQASFTSVNVSGSALIGTSLIVGGPITGGSFAGVGTSLTLLNASNLASGTVPLARLGASGTPGTTTFFRGDNSWQTAVTAVTVVNQNGVSASVSNQGTTPALTFTLGAITPTSVTASATIAVSGTISSTSGFTGPGTNLTLLNASNLASGTVDLARLGTGTPDGTKFLSGTNAWATALTAISIVSANGISGSIATASTTPAITLTLGAITPASVAATGNVGGATLSSSGLATLNSASVTNNLSVGGNLTLTGTLNAASFSPTGSTIPVAGFYASVTGGLGWSTTSTNRLQITSAGQIQRNGPVTDRINAVAASAVDCSLGNYFTKTVTGALTWTFTNVPTGVSYAFRLKLRNGGTGTQTWPSTVKWPNTGLLGAAVVPSLMVSGYDIIEFVTDDGGASWRGIWLTTTNS